MHGTSSRKSATLQVDMHAFMAAEPSAHTYAMSFYYRIQNVPSRGVVVIDVSIDTTTIHPMAVACHG